MFKRRRRRTALSAGSESLSDSLYDSVILLFAPTGDEGATVGNAENVPIVNGTPSTFHGTAKLDDALTPALGYTTSLLLDGNSDYVSYASKSFFSFPANTPFTIEAWVYPTATGSTQEIITRYAATGSERCWALRRGSTALLNFIAYSNGTTQTVNITSTDSIAQDEWSHVMVTRTADGLITLFVNGVAQDDTATVTSAIYDGSSGLLVGALESSGATNFFAGNISEARVLSGIAAQTVDFSVPTAPYTRGRSDDLWRWTMFLQSFDGDDEATEANDESLAFEFGGTAQIDTDRTLFSGSTLLLDGNSDYISCRDSGAWIMGADTAFCIEAWCYLPSNTDAGKTIVAQYRADNSQRAWQFNVQADANSNVFRFAYSLNGVNNSVIDSDDAAPENAWTHVAVTRTALGTINMWVNGVKQADEDTGITSALHNSTHTLDIGRVYNSGSTNYWPGSLADIRITKGDPRYTTDFTPPTARMPAQ